MDGGLGNLSGYVLSGQGLKPPYQTVAANPVFIAWIAPPSASLDDQEAKYRVRAHFPFQLLCGPNQKKIEPIS